MVLGWGTLDLQVPKSFLAGGRVSGRQSSMSGLINVMGPFCVPLVV